MTEQEAAAEMALYAEAAKRDASTEARRSDQARYLAEIITAAGWTAAEIVQLRQEYDYESGRER
jgi:hypothetical protein